VSEKNTSLDGNVYLDSNEAPVALSRLDTVTEMALSSLGEASEEAKVAFFFRFVVVTIYIVYIVPKDSYIVAGPSGRTLSGMLNPSLSYVEQFTDMSETHEIVDCNHVDDKGKKYHFSALRDRQSGEIVSVAFYDNIHRSHFMISIGCYATLSSVGEIPPATIVLHLGVTATKNNRVVKALLYSSMLLFLANFILNAFLMFFTAVTKKVFMIDAVTLLDTGEAHLFPTADALKDAIDARSRFLAQVGVLLWW